MRVLYISIITADTEFELQRKTILFFTLYELRRNSSKETNTIFLKINSQSTQEDFVLAVKEEMKE